MAYGRDIAPDLGADDDDQLTARDLREQEVLDEEPECNVGLNTMNNECRTGITCFE